MGQSLNDHIKGVHNENGFQCNSCDKSFTSRDGLRKHVTYTHDHPDERYECDLCDKVYMRKCSLRDHKNEAHRSSYVVNMEDLKEEPKVPNGPTVPCKLCHKTFSSGYGLLKHQKTKHDNDRKTYQCEKCEKNSFCPKISHRMGVDDFLNFAMF